MSQEFPNSSPVTPEDESIPLPTLPVPVRRALRRSPQYVAALCGALALWDIYQLQLVKAQQISLAPQLEQATTLSLAHQSTLPQLERERIFSNARRLNDEQENLMEIFIAELLVGSGAVLTRIISSYPNPQSQTLKPNE